ncbi:RICIN domain-containing protein, partial [Leptospira barantonii]|uniref:RICIN domain-containing protein n=1 Tax=Leptospira barantonii TaxID=2023184 RepID=UPI001FEFEAD6
VLAPGTSRTLPLCFAVIAEKSEPIGSFRKGIFSPKEDLEQPSFPQPPIEGKLPVCSIGSDFSAITAKHSGRVLDVPGASTADNVNLDQYTNWGADNEKWMFESTGDGYFKISSKHSGKCMDVKGASNSSGTNVVQYSCGSGSNQRFQLLPYGDGYFSIQAKHSSQCLDIAGGALGDGGLLIQWPCAWTDNEKFRFSR